MSLPEVLLWQELRKRPGGFKFRRQYPHNRYIIDFACLEARLAIEVDGKAHDRGDRPERDAKKDAMMTAAGFDMMRIPARDLLRDLDGTLRVILARCGERGPLHHPAMPDGPPPRSGEDFQ